MRLHPHACILLLTTSLLGAVDSFQVDAYAGADDRTTINNAFVAMRALAGPKRLVFSPRTYRVTPREDDGYVPVLDLAGVGDLDVDGNGAVIEARNMLEVRQGYLLGCHDFTNVHLHDLCITYRPLTFVQGRITAVDQAANRVEVALEAGFDAIGALRSHATAALWCRAGQYGAPHLPKAHSPSWLAVASREGGVAREDLGPGRWRLQAGGFDLARTVGGRYSWAVGDPLVVWQRGAQDALAAWSGRGLRLSGIVIDSALHFAIKVRGVEQVEIAACRVEPASGAWFSGSADGIDVQQCRDVTVHDCRIVANGDDAVSFLNHGHGQNGTRHETRFSAPLPDTNEDVRLYGNRIAGGNRNGMLLLATRCEVRGNTVEEVRQYGLKCTGDDALIIVNTFDGCGSFTAWRHIADELSTGIICSDEWTQRRWTVRGNTISAWYHMPGLLLKSVEQAVVEDNRFLPGPRSTEDLAPHDGRHLNAAIRLTNGIFRGRELPCIGITLRGNRLGHAALEPLSVDVAQGWDGTAPDRLP
jgi:hypothetical protein